MFIKHFVRFNTRDELDDYDVIDFFDIVQSVVPSKIVKGVSVEDNEKVSVDVLIYEDADEDGPIYIHEIILEDQISEEEGNRISRELIEEFPDQDPFTFEASIEL
jgi:hypothetical protein|tara:strand:+ start:975 stop:1289 length:315 start_codon:yes stop_codon:yes gene_type:complete